MIAPRRPGKRNAMRPQGWSGKGFASRQQNTARHADCSFCVMPPAHGVRAPAPTVRPFLYITLPSGERRRRWRTFASLSFFPPPALRRGPVRRPQPQPAPSTQKGFASPCFPALPALCAGRLPPPGALARLLIHFDNGFYHLIQIGHPFRQRYFDS